MPTFHLSHFLEDDRVINKNDYNSVKKRGNWIGGKHHKRVTKLVTWHTDKQHQWIFLLQLSVYKFFANVVIWSLPNIKW
jgi:hypothetical protein